MKTLTFILGFATGVVACWLYYNKEAARNMYQHLSTQKNDKSETDNLKDVDMPLSSMKTDKVMPSNEADNSSPEMLGRTNAEYVAIKRKTDIIGINDPTGTITDLDVAIGAVSSSQFVIKESVDTHQIFKT